MKVTEEEGNKILEAMESLEMMTVEKLIEELQKVPKEYQIAIQSPEDLNMAYPVAKLKVNTICENFGFVVLGIGTESGVSPDTQS